MIQLPLAFLKTQDLSSQKNFQHLFTLLLQCLLNYALKEPSFRKSIFVSAFICINEIQEDFKAYCITRKKKVFKIL